MPARRRSTTAGDLTGTSSLPILNTREFQRTHCYKSYPTKATKKWLLDAIAALNVSPASERSQSTRAHLINDLLKSGGCADYDAAKAALLAPVQTRSRPRSVANKGTPDSSSGGGACGSFCGLCRQCFLLVFVAGAVVAAIAHLDRYGLTSVFMEPQLHRVCGPAAPELGKAALQRALPEGLYSRASATHKGRSFVDTMVAFAEDVAFDWDSPGSDQPQKHASVVHLASSGGAARELSVATRAFLKGALGWCNLNEGRILWLDAAALPDFTAATIEIDEHLVKFAAAPPRRAKSASQAGRRPTLVVVENAHKVEWLNGLRSYIEADVIEVRDGSATVSFRGVGFVFLTGGSMGEGEACSNVAFTTHDEQTLKWHRHTFARIAHEARLC